MMKIAVFALVVANSVALAAEARAGQWVPVTPFQLHAGPYPAAMAPYYAPTPGYACRYLEALHMYRDVVQARRAVQGMLFD